MEMSDYFQLLSLELRRGEGGVKDTSSFKADVTHVYLDLELIT